jgi:16S rRNA (guanine527-N7)-methyltransferase
MRAHDEPPARFCDLGAGGGVPGLVLAVQWPSSRFVLLDSSVRRCEFLREAIGELALGDRGLVAEGRAEDLARSEALEGTFDLVVARSFGPPAVVAECAVRFLQVGGELMVAEPPAPEATRWPKEGLLRLGLGPSRKASEGPRVAAMARIGEVPDRYPRRVGVPGKRPLF